VDLLTHSVAGTALAVTVLRGRERSPGYSLGLFLGALAGVFPDCDDLGRPFGAAQHGLSYTLYHRGWTHTIVACLAFAIVVFVLAHLVAKNRPPVGHLFGIGLGASLLHVLMDSTNDYGVHPFWPFANRWIYGDFIFLLEPLVVTSLLPLALSGILQDRGSRAINMAQLKAAVAFVLLLLGFYWYRVSQHLWLTPLTATVVSLWLIGQLVAACAFERRAVIAWSSLLAVMGVFWIGSVAAKRAARRALNEAGAQAELIQLDATPAPANPFCWRLVAVARQGDEIVEWMGIASLWPRAFQARDCRAANSLGLPTFASDVDFKTDLVNDPASPKQKRVRDDAAADWIWIGRFTTPRSTIQQVTSTNCLVKAQYSQLRAPILQQQRGNWVLGDVRLDYESALDEYCKYEFGADERPDCDFCHVPWFSPTFEQLEPSASH
jgi:inner membrane protein